MEIKEITLPSDILITEINLLLSQLTTNEFNFSFDDLKSIINSNSDVLFGAFESNKLVGILTLVTYRIPTGKHGRIEDVVVDKLSRGKGIGKALTIEAMQRGSVLNLDKLSLTSNPRRVAANRLYQKIGFQLRETNSYVYTYKK